MSDIDAKKAKLEALKKEIEEAEATEAVEETQEVEVTEVETTEQAVTETVAEETEAVEAVEAEETEAEVEATKEESEEVEAPVVEETKQVKETKNMSDNKDIAAAEVQTKAAVPSQEQDATKKINKREARKMLVNALAAKYAKNERAFADVKEQMQAVKVIDGTTGAPLMVEEVLADDIRDKYENIGNVGQYVNRIDIEGAETFRQLVETAGNGFTPVALGYEKDLDQPVWTSVTFEPFEWALIVAWLDGVQKRSPIAVYNQIVRYIAKEYSKLEDKIILTYAGGTYDGETRPATGLVPILTTASRVTPVASYDSEDLIPAIGEAYGEVESDGTLTLVVNRKTWGAMAVSLDNEGRPVFTAVGSQVAAGALGTFNVALSSVLSDGDIVIGDFQDYNLVTRGGLETLFSREATVGSSESALNLFTQDASALRADVDITGKPVLNTSFQLLQVATS